jgi:uncharacterized protein YdaU (DUF1376 family)
MNKAPAFQFYVADYMRDTRCLSLAAKGAWTDCLCAMWFSSTRGEITYPLIGYARLFGCTVEQAEAVINELVEMQTCNRVTHGDGKVTLTNRRMQREAKEREQANNRQNKYRDRRKQNSNGASDGKSDAAVTLYSSSSSSTTISSNEENSGSSGGKPPAAANSPPVVPVKETLADYLLRKQLEFPHFDVQEIYDDFSEKCGSEKYRNLKNIPAHFDKWLETQQLEFVPENTSQPFVNPAIGKPIK